MAETSATPSPALKAAGFPIIGGFVVAAVLVPLCLSSIIKAEIKLVRSSRFKPCTPYTTSSKKAFLEVGVDGEG